MLFHIIPIEKDLFAENSRLAAENREKLQKAGALAIDFLGSTGSGKTALIEAICDELNKRGERAAAITGDVAGDDDAVRIRRHGASAEPISTGKECHLDAHMVMHALGHMDLSGVKFLFIENVGNLVCPVDFELGASRRAVVISITEGDDMVRKHPAIFAAADVVVLNKMDLAHAMSADPSIVESDFKRIKPHGIFIKTSAATGEGIPELMRALGI